jgi:threonine efflux protein
MNPVWLNIASVLAIFTLAIISPGPNFIMVVNTSLADSRRAGLFTALGVAVGSGIFALAGLLGLILLISSLPHFAVVVRIAGGGYLAWFGVGMIRKVLRRPRGSAVVPGNVRSQASPLKAFRTGLFTNLTNPKAWAFYFSLFTLVAAPSTPLWAKIFLNLTMFLISFTWYSSVALLLSDRRAQPHFLRLQPLIQGVLGILLVLLGGRLLLTR